MTLNQAFKILQKVSPTHEAKIILKDISMNKTQGIDKLNLVEMLKVFIAARKLRRGVPVAKIIREKWFYGMPFYTNKYTLDPRPDSETLIEAVLKSQHLKKLKILDLGTGTGCLICSIIKNLNGAIGIGIDKSNGALRVAKRNVKNLKLDDRIKIMHGDFTSNFRPMLSKFDIIVSNPPYIAIGDNRVDLGASYDPKIALYSGKEGLDAYRAISKNVKNLLTPNGRLFLEIGADQGNAVREIFNNNDWKFVTSYKDLSGTERVLEFV